MIGDLFDSPWKILIVSAVIIVLCGSAKLPHAARSLGKSMRILKTEIKDLHHDEPETVVPVPAAVAAPLPAEQVVAEQIAAEQVAAEQLTVAQQQLAAEQAQQRIDALQRQ